MKTSEKSISTELTDYLKDNHWKNFLVNSKVPGLMKDEALGKILSHFVGLKLKQYTYKNDGEDGIKKN